MLSTVYGEDCMCWLERESSTNSVDITAVQCVHTSLVFKVDTTASVNKHGTSYPHP